MKGSKTQILALMAALAFAVPAAYGDIANGTYFFGPSGNTLLWDISGLYGDLGTLGLGPELVFTLNEDSAGNITGTGNSLLGAVTVTGKILGSSAKTGATMSVNASGNSAGIDFNAKVKAKFVIDGPNHQLVVIAGSAAISETDVLTGKKSIHSSLLTKGDTLELPSHDSGSWNVTLNLTPNGNKYTGTATLENTSGSDVTFTATGTYSAKTDTSKIALKADGSMLNLVVSTSGPNITVHSINGKVFGQSLKIVNP